MIEVKQIWKCEVCASRGSRRQEAGSRYSMKNYGLRHKISHGHLVDLEVRRIRWL